jgi:hypothetical protein
MFELFQLTSIPLDFQSSDSFVLQIISILLGTKFGWFDIVAYLAGISFISTLDTLYIRKLP